MSLFSKELEEIQCTSFTIVYCIVKKKKKSSGLNLLVSHAHNFKKVLSIHDFTYL